MSYQWLWLWLFCIVACADDDFISLGSDGDRLIDSGIYDYDSSSSDAFCDFVLLNHPEQCWNPAIATYRDCHYDLLFTRYGGGWTGADAAYSLALPDGRILWMFGDTFLGTVQADRSRKGAPFIRNSLVVQDGDLLSTLHGGTLSQPTAFVSPTTEGNWYWPLDATVHVDKIQWLLGELGTNGTGEAWDFAYRGFDLAIMDPNTLAIESIRTVVESPDISYGSCLLEGENYIYIYGIRSSSPRKMVHLARAPAGNLEEPWTFYDGNGWIDSEPHFAILRDVSDQFSVIKSAHKYYLITHQTIFGNEIYLFEADLPMGPWTNKRILYCTPETSGQIFTYNSFVHPELSESGELRISYNINSFNFFDILGDVDLYRPRFISVKNWK